MKRLALLLPVALACATEPGAPAFLVASPRVLAVQAEPPEVQSGASATFRVLFAGPSGELDASQATWAICSAPLPLTESGAVASACLGMLDTAEQGDFVSLATTSDACSRFGPIPSPEVQRARDPDSTGGYYQPIRVELHEQLAFDLQRLRCPLTQASFQVSQDYERRYRVNTNPVITQLTASVPTSSIAANASIGWSLSWTPDSIETFPVFDPASLQLVDQQETFAVSWFATAGSFANAQTGSTGTSAANQWVAPANAGVVYLWAVLRDSRGGIAWTSVQATVVTEAR